MSTKPDILANLKTNLESLITTGFESLRVQREELTKQATGGFPRIEKIEPANPFSGSSSEWVSSLQREMTTRTNYDYKDIPPAPQALLAEGLKRLAPMKAKADSDHAVNVPKLASNKVLVEKLKALMKLIDMPDSWIESVYQKTRSRYGSNYHNMSRDAGYLGDIARNVKTSDGYETSDNSYKEWQAYLKRHTDQMQETIDAAKRKVEEEKRGTTEHQRQLAAAAEEVARLREQLKSASQILGE